MAILTTGQTFSSGDQVTSQKLMDIADLATFSDPADGATIIANNATYGVDGGDGKLKVKPNGIGSNELLKDATNDANRAVTTNHIKDDAVTSDKLAHISNLNVLGNVSGSTAAPVGVEIKDEDDMISDSDTSLVTQQSIKAYVDNLISNQISKFTSTEQTLTATSTITASHGLGDVPDLATGHLVCKTAEYGYAVGDALEVGMSWFSDGSPASSQDYGIAVVKNSSSVSALIGDSVEVPNRTNLSQAATITLGNWKIVLTALSF
jgi:hypothetical protein